MTDKAENTFYCITVDGEIEPDTMSKTEAEAKFKYFRGSDEKFDELQVDFSEIISTALDCVPVQVTQVEDEPAHKTSGMTFWEAKAAMERGGKVSRVPFPEEYLEVIDGKLVDEFNNKESNYIHWEALTATDWMIYQEPDEEAEPDEKSKTEGLTFLEAMSALQSGQIVARKDWRPPYVYRRYTFKMENSPYEVFRGGCGDGWEAVTHHPREDIRATDWRIVSESELT